MADIDIEPSALTEFAGNPQLDLDVDSLQGLASTASNGQSQLPEGNELFTTQRTSIEKVMAFLALAKLGNQAYRDGATASASLYAGTEDRVTATVQAVSAAAGSDAGSTTASSA